MHNELESSGYKFDTNGQATCQGSLQLAGQQQLIVAAVKKSLLIPVKLCEGEHEVRVAELYSAREFIRLSKQANIQRQPGAMAEYDRMLEQCLCAPEVRNSSPQCAHREQLLPNPYKFELLALIGSSILHQDSWAKWYHAMCKTIDSTDSEIGKNRWHKTKSSSEHRANLQQPIITELEQKRQLLLRCIGTVLEQ